MFRRFSVNYALFAIGTDACLLCAALLLATVIRPSLQFLPFAAEYPAYIATPLGVYLIFAIEWTAIGLLLSLYDGKKNLREVDEFIHLTLTALVAFICMAGTLYLTFRLVSRLLFFTFVLLAFLSMSGWRIAARWVKVRDKDNAQNQRRVLIVGLNSTGRQMQEQIEQFPQLGVKVVGYADDSPELPAEDGEMVLPLTEVQDTVSRHAVDGIIIAPTQQSYPQIPDLVGKLHTLPVKVWIIPDLFRLAMHKAAIEEFAGIPLLDLRAPALSDTQRLVKRSFDLFVTVLLLPFALLLMAIIALAIRIDSPGKVLLRQKRAGENGRIFWMYKFRTMVENAEELRQSVEKYDQDGNILHKSIDDPRVTRVGRILRRASVDELPQIYNVLRGEMSLVGPRPELPFLVERYKLWQRQRFAVPQGITGWWQIHGRSDRPMHLHTEDDLYYVQNYSIGLDIYILLKTLGAVIWRKGAF